MTSRSSPRQHDAAPQAFTFDESHTNGNSPRPERRSPLTLPPSPRSLPQSHVVVRLAATFIFFIVFVFTVMDNHRLRYSNNYKYDRITNAHIMSAMSANDVVVNTDLRIAWLMSFPNSGTTYTNALVGTVSGYNAATNYGGEAQNGTNVPVFDNMPNGPYYSGDPSAMNEYGVRVYESPPSGYILTKTHCGSYCFWCPTTEYITTATKFATSCSRGHFERNVEGTQRGGGKQIVVHSSYNATFVKKAVHLIRNPLDNIVARFHFEMKKLSVENKPQTHTMSREGFRAMCKEMDAKYQNDTKQSEFYRDILSIAKSSALP